MRNLKLFITLTYRLLGIKQVWSFCFKLNLSAYCHTNPIAEVTHLGLFSV